MERAETWKETLRFLSDGMENPSRRLLFFHLCLTDLQSSHSTGRILKNISNFPQIIYENYYHIRGAATARHESYAVHFPSRSFLTLSHTAYDSAPPRGRCASGVNRG